MCDLKFGPNAMWEKRIRQRAYEIYEARLQNSCLSSNELQDWLEAERTVLQEIQGAMVYLSAAKGFTPGGFDSVSINGRYTNETVWNYEAGFKIQILLVYPLILRSYSRALPSYAFVLALLCPYSSVL